MAKESTKRYAENKPLSIIDGIPVGIKGEITVVRKLPFSIPYSSWTGVFLNVHATVNNRWYWKQQQQQQQRWQQQQQQQLLQRQQNFSKQH